MKGALPLRFFEIINSNQWNKFIEGWQELNRRNGDRNEYEYYIKNYDKV